MGERGRDARSGSPEAEATQQVRGSSLLLLGRLLAMGINFATQIAIIRYLSKSDYGAFSYALSIVALGQSAIQLGLDRGLTRYVPIYDEQSDMPRLFGAITFVVGVVVSLGLLVVVAVVGLRSALAGGLVHDETSVALLVLMIGLAPIEALDNLLIGLLAAFNATRAIFLRRYVVGPLLRLTVVVVLVAGMHNVHFLAVGYVLAGLVGLAIFGAGLVRLLRNRAAASATRSSMRFPIRELLTFSLPLLTTDVVFMALSATDAVMLDIFGNTEDVAALRAVTPTAKLSQVVLSSFGILYVPFVARLFARQDLEGISRRYWQTAGWVVVLNFPIVAGLFLFADELTADLLGAEYASSAIILTILVSGYSTNAFFGFNGMTLNVFRAISLVVIANVAAVAMNVGANLLLIPKWGPVGAAAATALTFVAHNLVKQIGLTRRTGLRGFSSGTARLYLTAVASGTLAALMGLGDVPMAIRVATWAIISFVVLRAGRNVLSIDESFPELERIPALRRLFS